MSIFFDVTAKASIIQNQSLYMTLYGDRVLDKGLDLNAIFYKGLTQYL
jgi:hypothetical protein